MATDTLNGRNIVFPIYNENGTPFHNLVLRKSVVDSIVMSLGDKITGDVFYKDNTLAVTMREYIEYKQNPEDENEEPIRYSLVNPPTIVREGMVADNGELKGMTKYSFEFYHPMCQLSNFPFTDVATKTGEEKYLSQNKSFSWIGKPQDYIDKLNKNLQGTVWYVRKSDRFPIEKNNELSDVLTFDNVTVADAIKTGYETWDIPYVVSQLQSTDPLYAQGKRFVVEYGLPSNEIYESDSARQLDSHFVFHMGQGVGLKNNSRTPRNNKIVTRIAGYGSEDNVPYGYPQIVWTGNQDWDYTVNNDSTAANSYPIYKGIVGGQYVKLIKHPFTRTHLMPSIYTETVNKKVNPNAVGYNPNIEIKDYYDAISTQEYPYANEINPQAPSYESHEFADIKPELDSERSLGIVSCVPLDKELKPTYKWDDSMDDDGKYLQPYFQITLPQLDFDLYACAAITQEMQINMRGGDCIGCTFTVQVDWDDYKKNFYDSDGNFLPDGKQRDLEKYPKSNLGQISVVVQKDNTTFGTLMPNIYQQPKANDLFVFIGISLPLSYITSAEARLDDAMKSYMLKNNVFYFDYPLKFDEHFLTTHANILGQIRPNSIIHFDFGGVEQQLFVKQITVKYGNSPLPQYDITLTDNIEVVLNQIGQVADDVEKMSSLISILRQTYTRNVWNELAKKLSKTQNDTAQGFIRFMKGLQVGEQFVSGILGEGGVFRKDADGKTYLEADKMYVRMKAYFDNVEIRDYNHSKGNRIASSAGAKISRVAYLSTYDNKTIEVDKDGWYTYVDETTEEEVKVKCNIEKIRCYFRGTDGEDTVSNDFKIGDQVFCRVSNVVGGKLYQHGYWRLCIAKDSVLDGQEHWIDLSNSLAEIIDGTLYSGYAAGSDLPLAQDDIVQLGNVNDTNRQGAIIEYVTGEDAPAYQIYQGLGDISALSDDATVSEKSDAQWSLENKNYINIGYNSETGHADMKVYGDMYVGDRGDNPSSYIRFTQQHEEWVTPEPTEEDPEPQPKKVTVHGKVEIKAEVSMQSTFGGKTFDQQVGSTKVISDLQKQIDGAIETWFLDGSPLKKTIDPETEEEVEVLDESKEPYKTWLAEDTKEDEETHEITIVNTERLKHLGDLYYDNITGYGYRFANTGTEQSPVFTWQRITDTDVVEALRTARNAQDTANGKRTIYSKWEAWVKNDVNTLEVGDLFIPLSDCTDSSSEPAKEYKANKVYKCITKGANDFQEVAYTDDTYAHRFDYLSTALAAMQGSTLISGGLVLSNLIALRDTASTPNIQAGINGVVDQQKSGLGIASWYGGDMGDVEHQDEYPIIKAMGDNARWAKSIFRFDGSGYLAGGNITWDASGAVTIKNITTLYAGQSTDILNQLTTFSNMFHNSTWDSELRIQPRQNFDHINLTRGTGDSMFDITDSSVLNFGEMKSRFVTTAFFSALFGALKSDNTEMAVNDANVSTLLSSIKAKVGFWTEQYISALGKNGATSGGAISTLSDVELTGTPSNGQVLKYNSTTHKWCNADDEGVSTVDWEDVTNKPTEFTPATHDHDSRYYIANGTIYLGSNSLTPLTSFTETDPTVPAWAKAETKPLYAFKEITGKATALQLPSIENLTNFSTKVYDASESRTKNTFLAAPDGENGLATFRAIVSDDIPALAIAKITGLQTALDGKALKSIKIQAGNGLTGGGTLEANRTLSILLQANSGLSVNADGLKLDIVNNSSTSSDYKAISATQFKALYDFVHDLFTKETENGVSRIKANYGLYTDSFLSALGLSDAAGGIGDVTWDLLASAATGGRTIHASYITDALRGYATQAWVQQQGYLTSHQSLAGYATEQWVSANFNNYSLPLATSSVRGGVKVGYSESGKYYAVQLSNEKMYVYVPWTDTTYESKTEAQDGTAVSLVTTGEKYAWNHKTYTTSLATDNGTNQLTLAFGTKYKLTAGGTTFIFTMPAKPSYAFGDLTDHPTTLSGYGITDAKFGTEGADYVPITLGATTKNVLTAHQSLNNYYTKSEADNKYLTIVAFERLFQALDSSDVKVSHPYASGVASIKAMVGLWTNEYLSALGKNSASGGAGDVTWDLLESSSDRRQISISHLTTALSGYATQSWVTDNFNKYVLQAATENALGGIKIGYEGTGKNYPVQLDANNKAFVNVPWEDTTYTLAGLMGSAAKGGLTQPIYWDGSKFANTTYTLGKSVPADAKFTDTTYKLTVNGTTNGDSVNGANLGSLYAIATSDATLASQVWMRNANNTGYAWKQLGARAFDNTAYLPLTGGTLTGNLTTTNIIIPSGNTIKIGDAYLVWDGNNNAVKVYKLNGSTEVAVNFYATGGVSALGMSDSGSGGGVDMDTVWTALANNTNEQINATHLSTALTGYATQAWVQLQGYITSYTDTKNTAGATNLANTKLFIIGAQTQGANPQTYSYINCFIGTDGCLYSNGTKVLTSHQSLDNYVKIDAGATEQTIKNSIASLNEGVINLWRSNGDYYTFLGFSNGTTKTYLGGIGFKSQSDHNLYRKNGQDYHKILDASNYTDFVNATNFAGLYKTGTVTSIGMTVPTGFSVTPATITTNGTFAISFANGYSLPTTVKQTNWDTAYGWGDHADAGYLTGITATMVCNALGFTISGVAGTTYDLATIASNATSGKSAYDLLTQMFTLEGAGTAASPYIIKANYGLYTEQFLSALGLNSSGGSGGASALADLVDVEYSGTPTNGQVLKYNSSTGKWYNVNDNNTGTVTSVKVGMTSYNPSNGVVSLPAYPTTLPASDVSAWAKASTKPSYTLDEVSDGSTRKLSDYTKTTAFKSLSIQGNGTSVGTYSPTSALTVNIAAGSNISITNDTTNHKITIANTYSYTLPNATTSAKGGVIIGNGLSVSDGKVSLGTSGVTAGTYRSVTVDIYGRVTNGTNPTTLAGYGITDAKIASGEITLGSNTITPVTSVGLSAPTGFSVTNTPVTKTGTLTLSYASGYEGFTTTLKNKIDLLYSLFTREGSGTASDPYVIKANYGLYTDSFLSALGLNGAGGSGGATAITDLVDVAISSPQNGQVLKYNSSTGKWYNGTDNNSGTVTSIKVGTTSYSPSGGVVSLPAYPTKSSWNYDDMYVSAVALNGNYLRVTKNGTNNDLTIPYATSAGNADTVDGYHYNSLPYLPYYTTAPSSSNLINLDDWFSGSRMKSISYDYAQSSYVTNKPYSSDAGAVINMPTYQGTQLYFNYYNNDVKIRTRYNGHITNWATFITSESIGSQSVNYATSSGSCSGNAASSTILQTARTLWGRSFDGSANISGDLSNVGDIKIANNKAIRFVPNGTSDDADWNVLTMNTANALALGYYTRTHNQETSIQGGKITFSVNQGYGSVATASDQGLLAMTIGQDGGITLSGKKRITFGSSDAYIEVDSNGYFHFSKGLYSDSFVSALGLNAGGSGGAGDVTWELLANSSDTRQINKSHLTTALSGYATTSQLSGYLPLTGGTINGNLEVTSTAILNVANAVTLFLKEGWKVRMQESGQEEALLGFDTSHNLLLSVGERGNIVKLTHKVNGTSYSTAISVNTSNRLTADGNVLAYKSEIPSSSNFMTTNTDQNNLGGAKTWTQNASGQDIVYGNVSTKIEYTGITFSAKALGVSRTSTYTLAADTTGLKIGSNYIIHSGGGSMNGSLAFASASSAYSSEGVNWTNGSKIGGDTFGGLGIYADGSLYLRCNTHGSVYTYGVVLNRTTFTYNGNTVYHAGNFTPSNYISTSGGTITSDGVKVGYNNYNIKITNNKIHFGITSGSSECIASDLKMEDSTTTGKVGRLKVGSEYLAYLSDITSGGAVDSVCGYTGTVTAQNIGDALTSANYQLTDNNTARLRVGNVNDKTICTTENTDATIQFTGGTDGFTVTDGRKTFTVPVTTTGTTYSQGTGISISGTTISMSSTYRTYCSNGNTAYGWGNHANAGYLLKSGGTMSGDITLPTGSAAYSSKGIKWSTNAFIGCDVFNGLGVYATKIYLRPGSSYNSSSGKGVSISTTTFTYNGYTIYHSGNYGSSDARLKDILDYDVEPSVESIANAPSIRFMWNEKAESMPKHVCIGSIAQYWKAVLPESVNEGVGGYLCMQYDVIALLAAISIAKKVVNHEQRITELEKENERLRTELEQLKAA